MRVLVLGGTIFLGRHVVESALGRGHEVVLFHRGMTAPGLFPQCQHILGDREGALDGLRGERFDAVIDLSGKHPDIVARSADALRDTAGMYLFVSTASVYPLEAMDKSEDAPVLAGLDGYGALKAACEAVVRERFGARAHVSRPGLIAGPHDATGRFTYWAMRMTQPGPVLAPGVPDRAVQVIDARDVAAFLLDAAERSLGGTFNVSGPARETSMLDVLSACGPAEPLVWVPDAILESAGVEPYSEMPLWVPAALGRLYLPLERALAAGLVTRPLSDTARDTRAWAVAHRAARLGWRDDVSGGRKDETMTPEREAKLLESYASPRHFDAGAPPT